MNDKELQLFSLLIIVGGIFAQIFYLRPPFAFFQPTEPYPTLLLPAGEQLFHDKEKIEYRIHKIEAVSEEGIRLVVRISKLLDTVPIRYSKRILRRNLGLPPNSENPSDRLQKGRIWIEEKIKKISALKSVEYIKIKTYQNILGENDEHVTTKLVDTETIYLK